MGDKFDKSTMKSLPAVRLHASAGGKMHHYAMAKTACIVQVQSARARSRSPYVNPDDDSYEAKRLEVSSDSTV
jgi:hypothetical protein